MTHRIARTTGLVLTALVGFAPAARGDDWPQWRGPNRDAKVTGFKAPATWPNELTKKWKQTVGEGVSTPALVGDRLYVFSRQEGKEVTRALDANTGKEIWKDQYEAQGATGPASGFSGPRASPTVADGKVVTLGVRGALSCLDAATGKMIWRKDDFKSWPRFFSSSSPIVTDGLVIAQLGGESKGGVVAYDLATGAERWKWTDDGTAYASPSLLTVDGTKVVVAETERQIVGVGLADGKLVWKTPYPLSGKGRGYNASTPTPDGQTLIYAGAGRGTKAVRLEKSADGLAAKELWANSETSVQFNTPVVKDGLVFGISDRDNLFCITKDGKTAWTSPIKGTRGYGSVVDVGPTLIALTPAGELTVFAPSDKEFKELAKYKVADGGTYAYPVIAGNRIYVKDKDGVTLWTIE
jgi:outer membrane protein assembly factor BamB